MPKLIYCDYCEGYTEYVEYEADMKDGSTKTVVECAECEHLY